MLPFLLTPFLFSALSSHNMSSFSSPLSSAPVVAAHNAAPPLFLSTLLMLTFEFLFLWLPPLRSALFPSIWLLVSWYAGLDPHCAFLPVSTLFFHLPLHLSLSLFSSFQFLVSTVSIKKNSTKKKRAEDRACWGRINGWKQEEEKEDMGYGTRDCFHLKEELRKNITPWRDKGQEERGKERKMGEGLWRR